MKGKLTRGQEAFCLAVVETNNQSEAYRRAYPKSLKWKDEVVWRRGCDMAALPQVSGRISALRAEIAKRAEITAEKVLRELARIAFADIRKAVKWTNGPALDMNGEEGIKIESSVMLVPSEELDDDIAAAISEVSQTKDGIRIKFHSKEAALGTLAKHFGIVKENAQFILNNTQNVLVIHTSEKNVQPG